MVFLKISVFGSPSILDSIFLILRQSHKVGILSDFSQSPKHHRGHEPADWNRKAHISGSQ